MSRISRNMGVKECLILSLLVAAAYCIALPVNSTNDEDQWQAYLDSHRLDTFKDEVVNAIPDLDDYKLEDGAIDRNNDTTITSGSFIMGNNSEYLGKRVINGVNAPVGGFRWTVSIKGVYPKSKATTYCGASFISDKWLITAAHCFLGKTGKGDTMRNPKYWQAQAGNVYIELGAGNSKNQDIVGPNGFYHYQSSAQGSANIVAILNALINGQPLTSLMQSKIHKSHGRIIVSHFDRIIVHPKYKSDDLEWDIALIHLKYPVPISQLPQISTVHLPPKDGKFMHMPRPGEICVLVGWGCKHKGGGPSKRAQLARLRVIENKTCSKMYKHNAGLNPKHEFCAGYYKGNIGICPGDSGSGLTCNHQGKWYIVGVASATHALKPGSYPGLFTRVAYFRDWIDKVTNHGA